MLAGAAKLAVAETYDATGTIPADNIGAGLPAALSIIGSNVVSVGVANGVITITYGGNLGGTANNTLMVLNPDTSQPGSMRWDCNTAAGSTTPSKYRPANCRN